MTTDPQGDSPPVTHPETITLKVAQERPKRTAEDATKARTERRRRPLPPPKTIAAVALVVAALELLIWQVGGLVWGILIHAALVVGALVAVGVALAWRRRSARRAARSGTEAARKATTPSGGTSTRRGPLSKLFGRDRPSTAGSAGKKPRGRSWNPFARKPGVKSSNDGKTPPAKTKKRSNPFADFMRRLGGDSKPKAAEQKRKQGPGAGRSPGSSCWRNPFASRPGGKSPSGSPSGGKKPSPAKPNKKRPSFLKDFMRGLRGEDQPKPTGEKRKPSPGPSAKAKPAPEPQAEKPKKEKATATEQMVKEAVQQAADAKPAPVPTPRTVGGNSVGDMNRIRAAADDLAAALKDYDPETMHQMVRELPGLEEALSAVSAGVRHMASRAESEWPVATEVAEALRSVADDVKAGAGTAGEARGTVRRENETDIERGEAPRHGSRHIESKWDVGHAD